MFVLINTRNQNGARVGHVIDCMRDARDAVIAQRCHQNALRRNSRNDRASYFPVIWISGRAVPAETEVPWNSPEFAHLPLPLQNYELECEVAIRSACRSLGIRLRDLSFQSAHWAFVTSYLRSSVPAWAPRYQCVCGKVHEEFDAAHDCCGKLPDLEYDYDGAWLDKVYPCPSCGTMYPCPGIAKECCEDVEEDEGDMQ
jgi:hypothetical protein